MTVAGADLRRFDWPLLLLPQLSYCLHHIPVWGVGAGCCLRCSKVLL